MTAVTRYAATDQDAPILLPNVGSLGFLLATVLNSGYTGKSAAGWAIPYNDNYERIVFQNGAGSRQRYWQILDNLISTPNMASLYGFETMSAVDTGSGQFPTSLQIVSPHYSSIMKVDVTTQVARNWLIFANEKICYLLINPQATTDFSGACLYVFGDFIGLNSDDLYNSLLIGRIRQDASVTYNGLAGQSCVISSTLDGHHLIRSYTQLGSSIRFGKHGDNYKDGVQFPNPSDGSLIMSRIWITESSGVVRGYLPGLWRLCSSYTNFTHGDTFAGRGALTGKTFEIIKVYQGALVVETSNTWYS